MVKIPRNSLERIDLQATLQIILKNAVEALGGSSGVVAVWNEAEHRFTSSVSHGLDETMQAWLDPLLNEIAPDLAGSRECFTLLSELWPDHDLPASQKGIRQNPIIALPLRISRRSIGLIYILRPAEAGVFSCFDQPILAAFAEQAAVAVQNAKLAALLAEEKQRLEAILKNSADGIMSVDSRCRILGFNPALEKLTGYKREEALGKECFRILNLTDSQKRNLCNTRCPMRNGAAKDSSMIEQIGLIRAQDGTMTDVSMVYSIVRSTKGQPINAVVNVRDISKMREMESFRETILSMLGHELQTPLAIIKGYAGTLARTEGEWDKETLQKGLQTIEEESDRLSRVMNKLLLASRLSAGALKLEKEPVQLALIVQKVVRRLSSFTNNHEFVVDFPADFPTLTVEPNLIEQVFTNLIDNAVKYSPHGGKVTITGTHLDSKVKVTVSDQGVGIPLRDMDQLFQRFHRGEKGQSKIQGTGLGLYICKSIIEVHGGKMEVSSQINKGSEFSFTLPVE